MAREVLDQEAVGLSRHDQLARGLLDREPGGELLNVATCGGGRRLNLSLGGGEDLGLLLLDARANALLLFDSVGLRVGAHLGNLIVERRETSLDRVQAG